MRIEFLKNIDVELSEIPAIAWGRIQKRPHNPVIPFINPNTKTFEMPVGSTMANYFPIGAVVELPDQLAQRYIAAGEAKLYVVGLTGSRVEGDLPNEAKP